jgi:hypothetical protein
MEVAASTFGDWNFPCMSRAEREPVLPKGSEPRPGEAVGFHVPHLHLADFALGVGPQEENPNPCVPVAGSRGAGLRGEIGEPCVDTLAGEEATCVGIPLDTR